jgi:hypothetical protein
MRGTGHPLDPGEECLKLLGGKHVTQVVEQLAIGEEQSQPVELAPAERKATSESPVVDEDRLMVLRSFWG